MDPKEIPFDQLDRSGLTSGDLTSGNPGSVDQFHTNDDVDSSKIAHHHTIGISQNQVSPGTHIHDGIDSRATALEALYLNHDHYGNNPKDIADITNTFVNTFSTSTWTASTTNPTLGNGTLVIEWIKFGHIVYFTLKLTLGSTSSSGNGRYGFTLPFAVNGVIGGIISGYIKNGVAPNFFPCTAFVSAASDTIFSVVPSVAQASGGNLLTNTGWKAAWAAGDEIFLSGVVFGP